MREGSCSSTPTPTLASWAGLVEPRRCPPPPGRACGAPRCVSARGVYLCACVGKAGGRRLRCGVLAREAGPWCGAGRTQAVSAAAGQQVEKESPGTAGSKRPLGYSLDGAHSVPKNTPGLGPALQNFPSSFQPTNSLQSPMAGEEASSVLIGPRGASGSRAPTCEGPRLAAGGRTDGSPCLWP